MCVDTLVDARTTDTLWLLLVPCLCTGPLQVAALLRVQVGEGLERESEKADFAAEVAAMAAGGK